MKISYSESGRSDRVDAFLSSELDGLSRNHIQRLIRDGNINVNEKPCKASYILQPGDIISIDMPEPENTEIRPENIDLDIVFEDEDLLIVNKPKDMVVHPAHGHSSGTLVNAVMYHCGNSLSGINGELRPGIVHRIDKDTTGLLIICKNDRAHTLISGLLEKHDVGRKYIALVQGIIRDDSGTVDANISRSQKDRKKMSVCAPSEGRRAVTHYRVLERFHGNSDYPPVTLTECELETGRTHQIRVHMASIGHPVAGDELYGTKKDRYSGCGQYLHAAELDFIHPITGERLKCVSQLPDYFRNTLDILRRINCK